MYNTNPNKEDLARAKDILDFWLENNDYKCLQLIEEADELEHIEWNLDKFYSINNDEVQPSILYNGANWYLTTWCQSDYSIEYRNPMKLVPHSEDRVIFEFI